MTDPGHNDDVRRFYDDLAPEYDRMTDFQARLGRDTPVFEALVRKFAVRRAVDAGCGTGFHSILLARAGVRVTAFDLSAEMVRRAKENAARAGVTIQAVQSSFTDLARLSGPAEGTDPPRPAEPIDALFCMGNTLAHLRDDAALDETLRNFRAVVRPGGVVIAQILNYEKILAERREIFNVRKAGDTTFERKYSYGEGEIAFTITTTRPEGSSSDTVRLRPLTRLIIVDALRRCGFGQFETYGTLTLTPFSPDTSADLVVIATS